jgi:hypothetical protein
MKTQMLNQKAVMIRLPNKETLPRKREGMSKKRFVQYHIFPKYMKSRYGQTPKWVFHCSCCNQERVGMPCQRIASVCQGNGNILGKDTTGFPLSFWWNQYYLYGLSQKKDHKTSKEALIALVDNDMTGLACPPGRLDSPTMFNFPESVLEKFYKPSTDCLLNYSSFGTIGALQTLQERNNGGRLPESAPVGLSQLSCLPDQDDAKSAGIDWTNELEELSDNKD